MPRRKGGAGLDQHGLRRNQGLLARAAELNVIEAKIHATAAKRGESAARYKDWEDAAAEGHRARERMYPTPFWDDVKALRAGDRTRIEPALVFLETDPWCFRSGYVKADLMRSLSRVTLSDRDVRRVERILLYLVDVGDRREFGFACRVARVIDSDAVVRDLKPRLASEDRGVARRALQMLVSHANPVFDADELRSAVALLHDEASAMWKRMNRATDHIRETGSFPPIDGRDVNQRHWVRRVASSLGIDPYSLYHE